MIKVFTTVRMIYRLINNPITRFLFKTFFLVTGFITKWVFVIFIGPVCLFILKASFKHAFTKTLPKMLKKYFTVTFPKVLKKKLGNTFPINLFMSFVKQ